MQLHFLPGYSPELNPVELLNQDVKANAAGRRRARWPQSSPSSFGPICIAGSANQRWWPGSLRTQIPATPPNESPYLPAQVITAERINGGKQCEPSSDG